MFYRIIDNLGPPILPKAEALVVEPAVSLSMAAPNIGLPVEEIQKEYHTYRASLLKTNSTVSKKRLDLLRQAETIMDSGDNDEDQSYNVPITLGQWCNILYKVFDLEAEEIAPYLAYETGKTLPYDVAAISIFDHSLYVSVNTEQPSAEVLDEARMAIPQFDTARDTNKFAQIFSSGLLEGLYQIPGFTPQRPVSKSEALLLIKRMVEKMKLK